MTIATGLTIVPEAGAPSVRTQTEQRKTELKNDVRGDPLVQAVLARFPGAEIVEVRPPPSAAPDGPDEAAVAPTESDVGDDDQ